MSRLLITGATGFLGSACLRSRSTTALAVHACARRPPGGSQTDMFHRVDLLDPDAPAALIADVRPTHLLHLAWMATPGTYWDSPENDDWVEASMRLLDAFSLHGGRC